MNYYGDEPHQIVLYQHTNTLTRVLCTCRTELGIVPVTSGTEAALALFRPHKESVTSNG